MLSNPMYTQRGGLVDIHGQIRAPGFRSFGGETVPLKLFSENLFSEDYSTEVLQTCLDNVARDTSFALEKAFDHAKVRFNHFVKLGDDTGICTTRR